MDEGIRAMFEQHRDWFEGDKKIWQPAELQVVYMIFNMSTGENRRDTGCGSCRRAVVNRVKKMYQETKTEDNR